MAENVTAYAPYDSEGNRVPVACPVNMLYDENGYGAGDRKFASAAQGAKADGLVSGTQTAAKATSAQKAAGNTFFLGAGNTSAGIISLNSSSVMLRYDGSTNHYVYLGLYGNAHALCPNADNVLRLGTDGARWSAVWSASGTIQTSDAAQKKDIADLQRATDFILALRPVTYKFIDGESGRTHWGLIAQEVKSVMDMQGISDMDFAGWTRGPKFENYDTGKKDKNGDPIIERRKIPNEHEYGLRYAEFIAPLIATVQEQQKRMDAQQRQIDDLNTRVNALEGGE